MVGSRIWMSLRPSAMVPLRATSITSNRSRARMQESTNASEPLSSTIISSAESSTTAALYSCTTSSSSAYRSCGARTLTSASSRATPSRDGNATAARTPIIFCRCCTARSAVAMSE